MQLQSTTAVRTCKRCGTARPLAEFHTAKGCKDGHRPVCIPCVLAERRSERAQELEAARARDRKRSIGRKRELKPRAAMRDWIARNPEKKRAHGRVYDAIQRGHMTRQPCEVCGQANTHAHHEDYSKPLDVRWLCRTHHMEMHRLPIERTTVG